MADYSSITETPGLKASGEQLKRIYQRYTFARNYAGEKDILEVACGSGIGLGYLVPMANSVTGVDINEKNVKLAEEYYGGKEEKNKGKVCVGLMDAHKLGFLDRSFDLIMLFEAIYYLHEPEKFVVEAARVLRQNGTLLICTVNKEWEDFHPSPYTHKYFSVPELHGLLRHKFTDVTFFGGFPVEMENRKDKILSAIKRKAIECNLIPGSLKARSYLKRIFFGKLVPLPNEVYDDMTSYEYPVEIDPREACKKYKIIYVVAKK